MVTEPLPLTLALMGVPKTACTFLEPLSVSESGLLVLEMSPDQPTIVQPGALEAVSVTLELLSNVPLVGETPPPPAVVAL